jgi:hypothetical protein
MNLWYAKEAVYTDNITDFGAFKGGWDGGGTVALVFRFVIPKRASSSCMPLLRLNACDQWHSSRVFTSSYRLAL